MHLPPGPAEMTRDVAMTINAMEVLPHPGQEGEAVVAAAIPMVVTVNKLVGTALLPVLPVVLHLGNASKMLPLLYLVDSKAMVTEVIQAVDMVTPLVTHPRKAWEHLLV